MSDEERLRRHNRSMRDLELGSIGRFFAAMLGGQRDMPRDPRWRVSAADLDRMRRRGAQPVSEDSDER